MPNILVNSGPGTGKSYTGERITLYLKAKNKDLFLQRNKHTEEQLAIWKAAEEICPNPDKMLYMAYNNDIVAKSKKGVHKSCDTKTSHGAGYSVLNTRFGYLKLTNNRGMFLVQKITGKLFNDLPDKFKWLSTIKFVEKLKDELLPPTPENMELMKDKYDSLANYIIHSDSESQATKLLQAMKVPDRKIGIEYIDQVWLPLFMLKKPIYDLGIIDEAQDLSPARLLLARLLCKNCIFIGDPDQAINAFAGADPKSFDKIREHCQLELPLKVSFRCPANIVNKANRITPRAQLRGIKEECGIEKRITLKQLTNNLPEILNSGLIICRTNAPLIEASLKLMKAEIPNRILGDRLANSLISLVQYRKASSIEELAVKLDQYEEKTCSQVKDYMKEVIRDKCDCIRQLLPLCSSIDDVEPAIKSLLKPKGDQDHIRLCTIHKAKGMERPNIFILYPPVESEYAKTEDQKEQERNLHFVAITRTSKNLYWIERD